MIHLKKYPLIFTALLLWLLAEVIYWEGGSSREPVVAGKSLSFWLDQYRVTLTRGGEVETAKQEEAAKAIRQLGTNAIPQLLKMLRERDAGFGNRMADLLQKQRLIRIPYKPAWVCNAEASDGFGLLGADAKQAVTALVEIYERPPSASSKQSAANALSGIGPAAAASIPYFIRDATNCDASVRLWAVHALGGIHSEPATVVPVLISGLADTNVGVRSIAARSLGQYGPDARQAIPALIRARGSVIGNVDVPLRKIDPKWETGVNQ